MHVDLAVPYRDTAAADLLVAVRADGAAPAGLSAVTARSGPFALELRVLGASHAVVVDGGRLSEVVACGAPAGAPLASGVRRAGGLTHAIGAEVVPLRREHAEAVRVLAGDPAAIVAAFPGAPDALTALQALPHGGWRSWHLYPVTGEAVLTTTTLTPAP